jgi:CheY-like chemotaxis protein
MIGPRGDYKTTGAAPSPQVHPTREEELEQLLARERAGRAAAEATSKMKDQFLGYISHELRTPLTAILLWSRILRTGKLNENDRREALETIERSANAQSEMIEDLLDITRMMSGKLRLNLRDLSLAPVIDAAVDAVRPMAKSKDVTLLTDYDAQAGRVRGDPVRLQQVAWNLLTNAIRFTPAGGQIHVKLRRHQSSLKLEVKDSGRGISPQALPNVFDPLRKSEGDGSHPGGLGLGLALSRQLVELHGGEIAVHSDGEGTGATFTVQIPLAGVADGSVIARNAAAPAPHSAQFESSKAIQDVRVLLVEDAPDTRNVIRWLLEQSGAIVSAAGSAAEAVGLFARQNDQPFDILLSDIGMPGQDGNDLVRTIREMERHLNVPRPIPGVAVTGYSRDEDRRRAMDAGFVAFVQKPINPNELVQTVARLTGRDQASLPPPVK